MPYDQLDELFKSQPREPRQRRFAPSRRRRPVETPEPEPLAPEQPEEDKGWFRTYAPHAVRGLGGLLGVGFWPGAAAGGAAEAVAEGIEQGDWTPELNPKRIAAEAAIGGAGGGFAKLLGMGTSVARALGAGALLGGSAPIIRHGIEEDKWDPTEYAGEVGTGAAIGGAVGGGLQKLLNTVMPSRPAGPASRYEIETTSVPGGSALGPGKSPKPGFVNPVRDIHPTGDVPTSASPAPTRRVPYDDVTPAGQLSEDISGTPYMGGDVALLPSQERLIANEARAARQAAQDAVKAQREAEKLALEKKKLTAIQEIIEKANRGELEPHIAESLSATDPVTGRRLSVAFREAAEEGADDAGGAGGTLLNQSEPPVGPAGGGGVDPVAAVRAETARLDPELAAEIEKLRQELAQAQAAEASVSPYGGPDAESGLFGMGVPPRRGGFEEPPTAVTVAPEPPPSTPPSSGGLEAPIPIQPETPPPSPLAELLGGKQAGKTRAKRPRKTSSERFDERAAKIAADAGDLRVPEAPGEAPWRTVEDGVEVRGGLMGDDGVLRPIEDVPEPPRPPRDPNRPSPFGPPPVDMAALEAEIAASAPQQPQSLAELLAQADPNRPETTIMLPGEGIVSAPAGADPAEAIAALRGAGPEAPALPEAPQDLLQILRTRVGASGKNYRLARDAAKSGEIPSADFAREAHLREQAAARGRAPVEAPAPTNWMQDEAAEIARLEALPPEQRLAAFLGQETPTAPSMATPDIPVATPEAEPEWVSKLMAEVNEMEAQKAAIPEPKPPVSTVAELLGEGQPLVPPTAAQIAELQALRQQSGAVENPADLPDWLRRVVQAAPEAPPAPVAPKAKGRGKTPTEPPPPTVLTKPGHEGAPRLVGRQGNRPEPPPNPQDYKPEYRGPKTPDPTKGGASVPMMITRKMEADLRAMGISQADIDRLTPKQAWDILDSGGRQRGAYPAALAAKLGLGLAGAAVGGATDPLDDPLLSALAGGAVGLSLPTMAQGLMKLGAAPEAVQSAMQDLNLPDGVKRATAKIGRVLPQIQRANYLADVVGLPANALFGPYGSGLFGALERGLAGDPRGWAVLNELKNPWNFLKEYRSAFEEARQLVGRAEGFSEAEATTRFEKGLTLPGTTLTAGDVSIRRILERHGFSDEEARIMTMTWEPFTKSGEWLAHGRGLIADVTFPFKRTPVNIVEQGLLRTPGVGFLQQGIGAARGTRAADPLGLQVAQQGIGLGIGLGSEQLGENLTPEQARVLRRFVTNTAGPYSLLAGAGFAAGQARRRGLPMVGTAVRNTAQQLPLPSIEPIQEALGFGAKLVDQGPSALRETDIPRGAYPAALTPSNMKRQYEALASLFNGEPQLPPRRPRSSPSRRRERRPRRTP